MPTYKSQQALVRQQIQRIVQELAPSIGISPSRVQIGMTDLATPQEFFQSITGDGPYYIILPSFNRNRNIYNRTYDLVVQCKLYFGVTSDVNQDSLAIEDVWTQIEDAVVNSANYINTNFNGAPAPKDGNTAWSGFVTILNPIIGLYTQEFVYAGTSAYS